MSNAVIETQEVDTKAFSAIEQAERLVINTDEQYVIAGNMLKYLKDLTKEIKSTFRPHIEKAHATWKGLLQEEKKHLEPVGKAEKIIKQKMGQYVEEQERRRKEEERRRQEELQRQMEEQRLREAEALEAEGLKEEAEALLEEDIPAPPVISQPATPKIPGLALREEWKFKIVDEKKIPREYLKPDEVKIRKVVKALKGETRIPGIQVYSEKGFQRRSG